MEMADVILIFAPGQCERFDDELLAEEFAATNVDRVSEGAIACTVPSYLIHRLEHDPRIAYVRRVQAYLGSIAS